MAPGLESPFRYPARQISIALPIPGLAGLFGKIHS
jgi:hypothetical protein